MLEAVCKRIAAIEATLREYSTDVPQVAADIIRGCDADGEKRRLRIKEKTEARIKKFTSQYHHNVFLCRTTARPPANDVSEPYHVARRLTTPA